jgi:transposase
MKAPEAEGMPRLDISREELEALLEQARQEPLREEGYQKLRAAIRTLHYVTELLEKKETTLKELRELLCPASTEKTEKVLQQAGIETGDKKSASPPKKPRRGHGRNAAAAYHGAKKSPVPPASLKPGDACPDGCGGKVYPQREPGVLVRIKGQPPLAATIYELEKLRCNLCGKVYTADAPPEAGEKKYDETAVAMMALLRYGTGVPLESDRGLEANFGIPLPAATQCEILAAHAVPLQPALEEFKRQAAQSGVVHNDDTSMRVLSLDRDTDISPERTGVFTSGLIWLVQKRRIALYFTGCKHAGENLAEVLKLRSPDLPPIIQVCDALSRNVPKVIETLVAKCNAHGRRNFVRVTANFPEPCRFVLETFREIYGYDAVARKQGMSAEERLAFHPGAQ